MAYLPSTTGLTDLRNIAVARLMLDNVPHIKVYWIMTGLKTAQVALRFGADDIDGTVTEGKNYTHGRCGYAGGGLCLVANTPH